LLFVPEEKAIAYHQDFKMDVIARIKKEGGIIKNSEIQDWIDEMNAENRIITS